MHQFAILTAIVSAAYALSCSQPVGPCLTTNLNEIELALCPEGMACVGGNLCCKYADVIGKLDECKDLVNPIQGSLTCADKAHLCNEAAHKEQMRTECPKTCNYC
ncbi:unnamed protein product [Caenorhabditis bovis]|uniref:ShKT domain-containing protein n=1 Tax=Caenorhabditis bovis TaxID=2654633 RepID=A0A8S1EAX9_9PELO|nr:unnamed protein product [Caenorhabditis bovis]